MPDSAARTARELFDLKARVEAGFEAQFERLAAAQLAALAAAGVDEIPAAGAPFDPRLHDGVGARPGGTPGVVLEVVRRGFRWRGEVLRRAQVVIAEAAE